MELRSHPEYYGVYLRDRRSWLDWQRTLATWKAGEETLAVDGLFLEWTPESARAFSAALAAMFQEYNEVLWRRFPYCRHCRGQCCLPGASGAGDFDFIALSLLGGEFPSLPEHVAASAGKCIYLAGDHCSWPEGWRTIKCWSFFCLGSDLGVPLEVLPGLLAEVREELRQIVTDYLPDPLRRYECSRGICLVANLDDPVAFAAGLHAALAAVFVTSLARRYRLPEPDAQLVDYRPEESDPSPEEELSAIAEAVTKLWDTTLPANLERARAQLWEDIESLEWIIAGDSRSAGQLLGEIARRYAIAPPRREWAALWRRMSVCLSLLRGLPCDRNSG